MVLLCSNNPRMKPVLRQRLVALANLSILVLCSRQSQRYWRKESIIYVEVKKFAIFSYSVPDERTCGLELDRNA